MNEHKAPDTTQHDKQGSTDSDIGAPQNKAYGKDFYDFLAYAVIEWSKTHIVLMSPRMIELYGTDVIYTGHDEQEKRYHGK